MMTVLSVILAQGIPLSPPLQTRLIALAVVEVVLITTAALLYVLWVRLKKQPLDEWWAGREAGGFSPRTRALMEESESERIATAEVAAPLQPQRPAGAPPPGGGGAASIDDTASAGDPRGI